MAPSISASKTNPAVGEAVTITGTALPIEDIDVYVWNPKGERLAWYTIYLKTLGINSITIVPSRIGPVTVWTCTGKESGEAGNVITITVGATEPPPIGPVRETLSLILTASAGGTTDPAPGSYRPYAGDTFTATAKAEPEYELVRWELDGAARPAATSFTVTMDRDHTLHAVFEKGAPPPPPAPPARGTVTVKVRDLDTGDLLANAMVQVDTAVKYAAINGEAVFTDLDRPSYWIIVSLAGYLEWRDEIFLAPGEVKVVSASLGKIPAVDPWSALTNVVKGIWDLCLAAFTRFAERISAPIQAQTRGFLDEINMALTPGSPDKETEEKAARIAETTRRRQEELIRAMYKKSPALELAPQVAQQILTLYLGAQVAIEGPATVADNVHPIRSTRAIEIVQRIEDAVNWKSVIGEIAMMPTRIGLLPHLVYWFNSQFTPLIPGIQDLIVMLVREVITPEEYTRYAAMWGESKLWADRRWEAHWRLPAPEMIRDAFHRGLITAVERDAYMVLHDYKPSSRTGVSLSDLRIIAGLQKELIPRVDLRRGWELGVIGDEELVRRYTWLGYEDDAPLMAEIQKAAALDAERTGVIRAAGRLFRDRKKTETWFRQVLAEMRVTGVRQDLWVRRYLYERAAKPTPTEEAAEELAARPAEEGA